MTDKPKATEKHIYISDEDYKRVLKYKTAKYNGLNAMNKVLTECIHEGIAILEKRG